MILVNNPGSWSAMYPPLAHAKWHGCTPTDLVFPFFLFAVGNALAFVMPGLIHGPRSLFWLKVIKRTTLIFMIGLLLNMSPFVRWDNGGVLVLKEWDSLRYLGVLQRISLCFGASAMVVWWFGRDGHASGVLWVIAGLLVGYWGACWLWGVKGDPFSLQGYFGTAVDRMLLGDKHLYQGEGVAFDPEGLMSTPPAIAQVLLGWWVGHWIVGKQMGSELIARLFLWATAFLVIAYLWQFQFPLNKKIWTSTFVLHTTGLGMMGLASFIYLIDIRKSLVSSGLGLRFERSLMAWVPFFEVFGKNPLFVFVLSGLVPRFLGLIRWQEGMKADGAPIWTSPLPWFYKHLFANLGSDPRLGSFLYSVTMLTCYWLIARWLDRRRIYIRV